MSELQTHTIDISIHALFAEGDVNLTIPSLDLPISIHALFAEGDIGSRITSDATALFLSTPSSQRATSCAIAKT